MYDTEISEGDSQSRYTTPSISIAGATIPTSEILNVSYLEHVMEVMSNRTDSDSDTDSGESDLSSFDGILEVTR